MRRPPERRLPGRADRRIGPIAADDGPSPRRLPPRIALVGLPAELGRYLSDWIDRHWPEVDVRLGDPGQPLVADLVVVDRRPEGDPLRPTLWLAEIDRSHSVIRIGPRLWRTAMPTTGRRLKHALQACLDGAA